MSAKKAAKKAAPKKAPPKGGAKKPKPAPAAARTQPAPAAAAPVAIDVKEVAVYVGGTDSVLAEHHSGERRLSPGRNDGVPIALADHICGPGFGSAGTLTPRGVVKLFPDDHELAKLNDQRVIRAEEIHAKFREKNAGRV